MSRPTKGIGAWMGSPAQQAIASGAFASGILNRIDFAGLARQTETIKLSLATAALPSIRATNLAALQQATASIKTDTLHEQLRAVVAASSPTVDFAWMAADRQAPLRALAQTFAQQNASSMVAVDRLLSTAALSISTSGLGTTLRRYEMVTDAANRSVAAHLNGVALRQLTALPVTRYNSYLNGLPAHPIARRARVASSAGDAVSGLLAVQVLSLDGDQRESAPFVVAAEAVESWLDTATAVRRSVRKRLESLRPGLGGFLERAWAATRGSSYADVCTVGYQVTAMLDASLQELAPDEAVHPWLAVQPRRHGMWAVDQRTNARKPTRKARLSFALRQRSNRDEKLIVDLCDGLNKVNTTTMDAAQGAKHLTQEVTMDMARCLLMACESVLHLVLAGD